MQRHFINWTSNDTVIIRERWAVAIQINIHNYIPCFFSVNISRTFNFHFGPVGILDLKSNTQLYIYTAPLKEAIAWWIRNLYKKSACHVKFTNCEVVGSECCRVIWNFWSRLWLCNDYGPIGTYLSTCLPCIVNHRGNKGGDIKTGGATY